MVKRKECTIRSGVAAGGKSSPRHRLGDGKDIFRHPLDLGKQVVPRRVQAQADILWIAGKGDKVDLVTSCQRGKTVRRCQADGVTRLAQPQRQGQKRLDVAARTIGEDEYVHQ